ncbi:hypothetical protein [Sideroxydans sp.]
MPDIQSAITTFKAIKDEESLRDFISKYSFTDAGEHQNQQVINHVKGSIHGIDVILTRRWYDRCKTFSIQPDGNEVVLKITGMPDVSVKFIDDHC